MSRGTGIAKNTNFAVCCEIPSEFSIWGRTRATRIEMLEMLEILDALKGRHTLLTGHVQRGSGRGKGGFYRKNDCRVHRVAVAEKLG